MEANLETLQTTPIIEPTSPDLAQYFNEDGSVINDGLVLDALKSFMDNELPDQDSFEFALLSRFNRKDLRESYPHNYAATDEEEKDFVRAYNNFRKQGKNDNLASGTLDIRSHEEETTRQEKPTLKSRIDKFTESLDLASNADLTNPEELRKIFKGTFNDFPTCTNAFSKTLEEREITDDDEAVENIIDTLHSIYDKESRPSVMASKKNGTEAQLSISEIKKWLNFNTSEPTALATSFRMLIVGDLLQMRNSKPLEVNRLLTNFAENSDDTPMMLVISKSLFSGKGVYASVNNIIDYATNLHGAKKMPNSIGKIKNHLRGVERHVDSINDLTDALKKGSVGNPAQSDMTIQNEIKNILERCPKAC